MRCFSVLRANRIYLWLAFCLFAFGWVIGELFTDQILHVVKPSLEQLKSLAEKAQAQNSGLYTSTLIFGNNLRACVTMLLLGVLACAPSVLTLLFNGMMIGVMLGGTQEHVLGLVAFGILPHGIFEMPAIFISAAFGMKLGRVLLVPLREKTRWQSFKFVWREIFSMSWLVVLLLVIAAAVEGTLTPTLLHTFVVQ
ncbi:stage II sporulation protein M [Tumebacillus flagellatus]|uniref:Stage II sporulation protein M n=1 Tax=Tumebacillus flagellatus TaxID=1157490 RepID=A0A074LPJ9_9BACL|nr:stage II sporulation protein M [Tumebacillus flagellatus]KEO81773.1 hypothetical protein EL26_19345 [Tumebacillus flagellatus]